MKWKHCNYCPLDGTCENQDRGHECEMPVKKLLEENAQLHKFLEEFNALDVAKENQQLKELLKESKVGVKTLIATIEHINSKTNDKKANDISLWLKSVIKKIDNAIGEK